MKYFVERLLTTVALPPSYCFAESDAGEGDAGGGGGAASEAETTDEGAEGGEPAPAKEAGTEGAAEDEDEEQYTEIEYEGEKFVVPKKLKDAFQRNADYTNGKKALAETERTIKEQAKREVEMAQIRGAVNQDVERLRSVDEQLAQWDALTDTQWAALEAENPTDFMKAMNFHARLRSQRAQMYEGLRGKVIDLQNRQTTDRQAALDKAAGEIKTKIKDWSPEKAQVLEKFAAEKGFPVEHFQAALMSAPALEIIHDAYLYRQSLKQAAPVKEVKDPKPVKRISGVNTRADAAPSDSDDPETWRRKRNAQLRGGSAARH